MRSNERRQLDDHRHRLCVEKVQGAVDGLIAGPLGGKPVSRVIGPHHHPDHIGIGGCFKTETTGAEVVNDAHRMAYRANADAGPARDTVGEALAFYKLSVMDAALYEKTTPPSGPSLWPTSSRRCPFGLHGGSQAGRRDHHAWPRPLNVHIWATGHAREHATFWSRDDKPSVIAGDQILSLDFSPTVGVLCHRTHADPHWR